MRKVLLLLLSFFPLFLYSQTGEQKQKIESFKNIYKVENGNVVFTKILDEITGTKDEIFSKIISYMAVAYKDANSVIQQQDKENGVIIGKGIYKNFYTTDKNKNIYWASYDCNHIIRFDIKENRVRIIISISDYNVTRHKGNGVDGTFTKEILNFYPTTEVGEDIFINLCETIQTTFNSIDHALKDGSTITNNDW